MCMLSHSTHEYRPFNCCGPPEFGEPDAATLIYVNICCSIHLFAMQISSKLVGFPGYPIQFYSSKSGKNRMSGYWISGPVLLQILNWKQTPSSTLHIRGKLFAELNFQIILYRKLRRTEFLFIGLIHAIKSISVDFITY